jgi:hypothetical protein
MVQLTTYVSVCWNLVQMVASIEGFERFLHFSKFPLSFVFCVDVLLKEAVHIVIMIINQFKVLFIYFLFIYLFIYL